MQSIMKELYYGNIRPDSRFYAKDSPFMKAAHVKRDCLEKLVPMLNETEKELLEQYTEAQAETESIVDYDIFSFALRFGVLLMVEIFTKGDGVDTDDKRHSCSS